MTSTDSGQVADPPLLKRNDSVLISSENDNLEDLLQLYDNQIAGHGSECVPGLPFLRHVDGMLLKPMQAPPKGEREEGFYKSIAESEDPIDKSFRAWTPKFFGVEKVGQISGLLTGEDYLILEDLTAGLELPNILDVKIGRRTYGPDAKAEKQHAEDIKYAGTKKPLGFSVLGFIVHPIRGDSDAMTKYNKTFGSNLKTADVVSIPKIFFDLERSGIVKELVQLVIGKLYGILDLYERQRKYHTYATSILFAYDAKAVRAFLDTGDLDLMEASVRVKLIDFAHVFPAGGVPDENFLEGLRNLIKVFEMIL